MLCDPLPEAGVVSNSYFPSKRCIGTMPRHRMSVEDHVGASISLIMKRGLSIFLYKDPGTTAESPGDTLIP